MPSFKRDLDHETDRKAKVEVFDAVVVANGHHSLPRYTQHLFIARHYHDLDLMVDRYSWPEPWPGQADFKGHIIHSHSYKDPTSCGKGYNYHDKRVVVVGIGNSGVVCCYLFSTTLSIATSRSPFEPLHSIGYRQRIITLFSSSLLVHT
jgi:hypothetical protein